MEWKNITKEELKDLFENGLTCVHIAELYNTSVSSVYRKVEKFGLDVLKKRVKADKLIQICERCGKEYTTSKNKGYCSSGCATFSENLNEDEYSKAGGLGEQIIELRKQGLSYKNIVEQLGCSKSLVSYHCKRSTRIKDKERISEYKKDWLWKFRRQLGTFRIAVAGNGRKDKDEDWNLKFRSAVSRFQKRGNVMNKRFTYKQALDHIGGTKVKCYLTGEEIDLLVDDYHIDHIFPVSKGGENTLENLAIVTPEVNRSKSDMTVEEYLSLCKTVLENFGYEVNKQ